MPIVAFHCEKCGEVLLTPEIMEDIIARARQEGTRLLVRRAGRGLAAAGNPLRLRRRRLPQGDRHPGRLVRFRGELGRGAGTRTPALGLPADLYLEGSDQHRGWFHSSLLASVGTRGQAPYKSVLTHGFVMDGEGHKMSKSLGNVIAPQEVMDRYGAEILRLWVAAEDYRDDVRISPTS